LQCKAWGSFIELGEVQVSVPLAGDGLDVAAMAVLFLGTNRGAKYLGGVGRDRDDELAVREVRRRSTTAARRRGVVVALSLPRRKTKTTLFSFFFLSKRYDGWGSRWAG
jgi:hypothetical protein